jgi:cytidylate kinase
MIIALDGPSGVGKSAVARQLARALGMTFLDTGAMYRAVTLIALERGLPLDDEQACGGIARELDLSFDEAGQIRIGDRPGEPQVRSPEVTRQVSRVAAHPAVRRAIVADQRAIAAACGGVVAEGRDTTSVVFPRADFKFYLDATPGERARRRARQEGTPERAGDIQVEIEERDRLDSTRQDSPLRREPDARLLVTDGLTLDEVVERLLGWVREGS